MKNNQLSKQNQPVRGSKSGKPIIEIFDLLGRSWAMGILWHLSQQSCKFRELQYLCENMLKDALQLEFSVKAQLEIFALCRFYTTVSFTANNSDIGLEPFAATFDDYR